MNNIKSHCILTYILQTAYIHAPEGIKNAIMQPRILNSDPQSFFETSLWRKEKLICLSKMRKICADESVRLHIVLSLKPLEIFMIRHILCNCTCSHAFLNNRWTIANL